MYLNTKIFLFLFMMFLIVMGAPTGIIAQVNVPDESRIDRAPDYLIDNYVPNPKLLDVITTPDGFDNFDIGVDFAEPHITENPNDPLQYFNAFNINNAHRTFDGHDFIFSAPSFGTSVAGDPVTAHDSLGNLYYINMYGSISGAKCIKSTDGGNTWNPAVTAILGGDKCWLAADQTSGPYANFVYVTMTNSSFTGHSFARSTNSGATFTTTFTASGSPLPGAMPAVGPNVLAGDIPGGCVYFVTNTGSTFSSTYKFYVSTDGGLTFTLKSTNNWAGYVGTNVGGRNTVQSMRTRPYPFIAADNSYGPYRGRLYCVYATNTPAGNGNKPDIFCRYSDDQGATWSNAILVNDDINTTANHQWHPAIWTDKETGRLYVQWMDTRDTPTSDSAYIYATYSDDGGQTFAPNQRVSNQKMKINCTACGGSAPRYQGDYNAIVSNQYTSMLVWTDFRNNNFGSYVGYFPDFALLVSPDQQTIGNTNGEVFYDIEIPDVTLYTEDAIFSATISPTPASGTLEIDFPGGNTISSFPGSIQLRVYTTGTVTNGTYTIEIQGEGPNGTPVHRRTKTLIVDDPIPVELTSFTANVENNSVYLNWQTASELNNSGFDIERCQIGSDGNRSEWIKLGFIQGKGNSTELNSYSYIDGSAKSVGTYVYRLKQIDYDGTFEYSHEVEIDVNKPVQYELSQNYPNPFNPTTTISFSVPENSHVSLRVFDVLGNEVTTLLDEQVSTGRHEVNFDAGNLASGVYYYTLQAGNFTSTKKLMLMK